VTAAELAGLLSEPDRLRVVAALALGAATPSEVATATGLESRQLTRAVNRLVNGGLVSAAEGRLVLHTEAFSEAARAAAAQRSEPDFSMADPAAHAVLRAFVRDGRLTGIPSARGKRRVLLEHLARAFEPGMRYPEKEVDVTLRAWHPDYAALRRYLVDEGLLSREAGVYWRSGGPIDL